MIVFALHLHRQAERGKSHIRPAKPYPSESTEVNVTFLLEAGSVPSIRTSEPRVTIAARLYPATS
jgi:hypothetical protein